MTKEEDKRDERIAELEKSIREAIATLELDESSARPGWVIIEAKGILKEAFNL